MRYKIYTLEWTVELNFTFLFFIKYNCTVTAKKTPNHNFRKFNWPDCDGNLPPQVSFGYITITDFDFSCALNWCFSHLYCKCCFLPEFLLCLYIR